MTNLWDNSTTNKLMPMPSTLKQELPVIDSFQNMPTTEIITQLWLTNVIKLLLIPKLFSRMLKNNLMLLLLNSTVSMLELKLVKLKEIWNMLHGVNSMLNMKPVLLLVKMLLTLLLLSQEVLSSSNFKEESSLYPKDFLT